HASLDKNEASPLTCPVTCILVPPEKLIDEVISGIGGYNAFQFLIIHRLVTLYRPALESNRFLNQLPSSLTHEIKNARNGRNPFLRNKRPTLQTVKTLLFDYCSN